MRGQSPQIPCVGRVLCIFSDRPVLNICVKYGYNTNLLVTSSTGPALIVDIEASTNCDNLSFSSNITLQFHFLFFICTSYSSARSDDVTKIVGINSQRGYQDDTDQDGCHVTDAFSTKNVSESQPAVQNVGGKNSTFLMSNFSSYVVPYTKELT